MRSGSTRHGVTTNHDLLDWGLELDTRDGRTFGASWYVTPFEGLDFGEERLLETRLEPDASVAIWDVTTTEAWNHYVGRTVTQVEVCWERWDRDAFACHAVVLDFAGSKVVVGGEGDTVGVTFGADAARARAVGPYSPRQTQFDANLRERVTRWFGEGSSAASSFLVAVLRLQGARRLKRERRLKRHHGAGRVPSHFLDIARVELLSRGRGGRPRRDYGPTFRAMILFAAYVGLRPGELFALERTDVRGEEVTIRQNLDGTGALKLPKNGKPRVVILPPPAGEALLDVPPRLDVPWLFVSRNGRQFRKSTLLYYWNPVRAAFGRPGMDFYELRHFCATHLLELGVAHADVAVQLGHTDGGALVMSTYGHPSEDAARERLKRAYTSNVEPLRSRRPTQGIGNG